MHVSVAQRRTGESLMQEGMALRGIRSDAEAQGDVGRRLLELNGRCGECFFVAVGGS